MPSSAHAVYFYFSLCFLLSRSSMVLLLVSTINDRAREPLQLLRLIPSEAYHQPEVTRFAAELASDQVALTGAKFFNVTRRLFLAVLKASVYRSYGIMMLDFLSDGGDCGHLRTGAHPVPRGQEVLDLLGGDF